MSNVEYAHLVLMLAVLGQHEHAFNDLDADQLRTLIFLLDQARLAASNKAGPAVADEATVEVLL